MRDLGIPNRWTSCVKCTASSETYTSIWTRAISSPELERGHCSERRPHHANSQTANQVTALVSLKALTQLPDSQRFYFSRSRAIDIYIYIHIYVSQIFSKRHLHNPAKGITTRKLLDPPYPSLYRSSDSQVGYHAVSVAVYGAPRVPTVAGAFRACSVVTSYLEPPSLEGPRIWLSVFGVLRLVCVVRRRTFEH